MKALLEPKEPRSRLVRDPIHGDVRLSALEAAVLDTRVFQRLRYIRQNGLLHFVFPGAVHTRFVHSIGTMAMAGRVLERLGHVLGVDPGQSPLLYPGAVFRLAALLHDVGHAAFSHSIEEVQLNNAPFFGTLRQRLEAWQQHALIGRLETAFPEKLDQAAKHEELGLALIKYAFEKEEVAEQCSSLLQADPRDVSDDICALIAGGLSGSHLWDECAHELSTVYARNCADVYGAVAAGKFSSDLIETLHSLVSGTLDVDRMDYLIRDSHGCGVPYGQCDVGMLVSNLNLGSLGDHLAVFLNGKAADCLDDLLWSRYQLFVQVLNHRANVALNEQLKRAIPEALEDDRFGAPHSVGDYLMFTDDHVMDAVRSACIRQKKLAQTSYGKTLFDRKLPIHLGTWDPPDDIGEIDTEKEIRRQRDERAGALNLSAEHIWWGIAESIFRKPGGTPTITRWNRVSKRYDLTSYLESSHIASKMPARRRVVHFFVDRDVLKKKRIAQ